MTFRIPSIVVVGRLQKVAASRVFTGLRGLHVITGLRGLHVFTGLRGLHVFTWLRGLHVFTGLRGSFSIFHDCLT